MDLEYFGITESTFVKLNELIKKCGKYPTMYGLISCDSFMRLKGVGRVDITPGNPIAASHSRYEHSIGVYSYAYFILARVIEKLPDNIEIDSDSVNAFLIAALLHDLRHGFFSHVYDNIFTSTHETRTIEFIENPNSDVNIFILKNFGPNVLKMVISLLSEKEMELYTSSGINIAQLCHRFLSGTIDIDKFEYIQKDANDMEYIRLKPGQQAADDKVVRNSEVEAAIYGIIGNIDVIQIGDSYHIVFNEAAKSSIDVFVKSRARLYDELYFSKEIIIVEEMLRKFFLRNNNLLNSLNDESVDKDALSVIENVASDGDIVMKRLGSIILNAVKEGLPEDFLVYEFPACEDVDDIIRRLRDILMNFGIEDSNDIIYQNKKYRKAVEASVPIVSRDQKVNQYTSNVPDVNSTVIGVDLYLLQELSQNHEAVKQVKALFRGISRKRAKY